ncbi:MAG: DUF6036 family nucleotidyltransferase [Enhygromyxa sp.]
MDDKLNDDWREFLSLMISKRVKFLVLGGHAVSVHAHPRVTEDLDVFVEVSAPNARRLRSVLVDFGLGESAPTVEELATEGKVFMIGVPPWRIDILTKISGVRFETAWKNRVRLRLAVGTINVISRRDLIRNKRASGRAKDLADLVALRASSTRVK